MMITYQAYTATIRDPEITESVSVNLRNIMRRTPSDVLRVGRPSTRLARSEFEFRSSGNPIASITQLRTAVTQGQGYPLRIQMLGLDFQALIDVDKLIVVADRDNCSYSVGLKLVAVEGIW